MHKLFKRQLAKATRETGEVDLDKLAELVVAAYEEADLDRRRTDHAITLMVEEIQQSQTRLLEAFNVVPEGLVLLDAQGRYVLFNKKYVELYDTVRDKIVVGGSFAESLRAGVERGQCVDAIGREEKWLADRLAHNRQDRYSTEQRLHGDRWVRIEERRTADGGSIGVRIDITDLKRREEALRKRSEQLLEAQRLGKTGDWTFKYGDAQVWWSPRVYELLGYPEGLQATPEFLRANIIGDGHQRLIAAHSDAARTGKIVTVDIKMKRGDGSMGDFVVAINAKLGENGSPVGFFGTIQDISERKIAEEKLERLAYFDPLTGLANRALFHREIGRMTACREHAKAGAALLFLDLDRFKEVNDSLGHTSGDELLGKVAQRISRLLGPSHFFARLGGDEFAIIMQNCSDGDAVEKMARDIITAISGPIRLERGEVLIGTSIGIALIPSDGATATDLQRNADLALYRAKESGRGRIVFFEPAMSAAAQNKIALARELRLAISEDNGLAVHYQPQIALAAGRVSGFEALVRWKHPTLGNIPPSEFIPIAESSRLICDLGLWVLRQAAGQAKTWLDAGEPPREIAVNVSAAQIWYTDFISDVAQVLRETGLPPHLLCLELTESLFADHAESRVQNALTDLKRLGVTLALDDFGTDYSSLGYLTKLPFDKIKVDRIFVDGITRSERARKLLEGITALGRGLGLTIIAEGAETVEELAILNEFRCDAVQGYVFARPATAPDALAVAHALEAPAENELSGADASAASDSAAA